MLQQRELKQITQQILPVILKEIEKKSPIKKEKTKPPNFTKYKEAYPPSPDSQLIHHIDTRFVEQREYSDKINAEQRRYSDKINEEQGKRIELIISQMDKRFTFFQWIITGGFGLILVMIAIVQFFLLTLPTN